MWPHPEAPSGAEPFPAFEDLPPPPGPTVKPNWAPFTSASLSRADYLSELLVPTRKSFFCRGNQTPQSGCLEWWAPAPLPPELGAEGSCLRSHLLPEQAAFVAAKTHGGAPFALCSESPPLGCFTCLVLFPAVQVLPLCSDRKIMPHLPAVSISGSYFGTLARSGFIFPTLRFCLWLLLCWVFSGLFLIPSSSVPSAFLSKSVVFHFLFLSLRSVIVSN